jgi:two-component system chemotaxis response regulator CheB
MKKILIVEDEKSNALLLQHILKSNNYAVDICSNGKEALQKLIITDYDYLLTDWMMPVMDGIELITAIREKMRKIPIILMITHLDSEVARNYALDSGADDFLTKPIEPDVLFKRLDEALQKKNQPAPAIVNEVPVVTSKVKPPFPGIAIASSTGGPPAVKELMRSISQYPKAAFFIVQHGPEWMFASFVDRLNSDLDIEVVLSEDKMKIVPGKLYVARGDMHTEVTKKMELKVYQGEKVNFARPAADPLFKSMVDVFGKYSVGAILTGLGRDGTEGAVQMYNAGAKLFAQDPEQAVAPSMPKSLIKTKVNVSVLSLKEIAYQIDKTIIDLSNTL